MLTAIFIGFLAGVALQMQQAQLWSIEIYQVLVLAGLLGLLAMRWLMRFRADRHLSWLQPRWHMWGAALLVGLSAFAMVGWRAHADADRGLSPQLEGVDVEVTGVVATMVQNMDGGLRFRFQVEHATLDGQAVTLPATLQVSWYERASQVNAQKLQAGDRWRFQLRPKAPHGNRNPYGFDYELSLWEQGMGATAYVRDGKGRDKPQYLGRANPWNPNFIMERARQNVRDAIFNQATSGQLMDASRANLGVVAALVMGDQQAIERGDWDVFRATGVAHLMSISGLHITLFAWAASLLVTGLWRRSAFSLHANLSRLCLAVPAVWVGLGMGVLLAMVYAWFSGWGVPAQRTIWMLTVFTALRIFGIRWPWYVTWLLAACWVLLIDPWAILQAGFWLSFVAVAVLFGTNPEPEKDKEQIALESIQAESLRLVRGLHAMLREQWMISLALAPLTLVLFQQVSMVGLLANAIAVPLVTFVITPMAFLGVLVEPIWSLAAGLVSYLALFLRWLASLPFATFTLPAVPLPLGILASLGGVGLVLPIRAWRGHAITLWQRIVLCALLLLPSVFYHPSQVKAGEFELMAIDIGQGNAVLVRTAHHALLYDTGPRFSRTPDNGNDAGHRSIVPLLRALGIELDTVVLSHKDSDHTGGARAVLAYQAQSPSAKKLTVLSSVQDPQTLLFLGLPADTQACYAGLEWDWDGVHFAFIHPDHAAVQLDAPTRKPNAIACVLKISNTAQSALLTADIEAEQEARLVNDQAGVLKSDVLLVPHHGSKTSSTPAFLDAVAPRMALVQAGYRNRFAHPAPEVMARYDERHIRTIESITCGAATWRSDAPEHVTCERESHSHYWQHRL